MPGMDEEMQDRHLALAERRIAEGRRRVREQEERLAGCRRNGHDVAAAENVLEILRRTLRQYEEHHALIVREIERRPGQAAVSSTPAQRERP